MPREEEEGAEEEEEEEEEEEWDPELSLALFSACCLMYAASVSDTEAGAGEGASR